MSFIDPARIMAYHPICERCSRGYLNHNDICTKAADSGHLECLKEAHRQGYLFTYMTCAVASTLECLQYAHENGCPWNVMTLINAATHGRIACLEYALTHKCPRENADICWRAAASRDVNCLKYCHEYGIPWNETTCTSAASNNTFACLQYAHEHGCPWNKNVTYYAARHGSLEMLRYAHERGCLWHESTCEIAAAYNHIECLAYAYTHGCPWTLIVTEHMSNAVFKIWNLNRVSRILGRTWREKQFAKRRNAVKKIEEAVLEYLYRPEGMCYHKIKSRFQSSSYQMLVDSSAIIH